jgi:3-hydroxyacyl-CoA dehydrogenase
MGVKAATELMLSGQQIGAKAGLAAGLVDKLEEGTDARPRAWPMLSCWQGRAVRRTATALPDKAALARLELRADTAKKRAACSRR